MKQGVMSVGVSYDSMNAVDMTKAKRTGRHSGPGAEQHNDIGLLSRVISALLPLSQLIQL